MSNRSVFRSVALSLAIAGSLAAGTIALAQQLPKDLDSTSNARLPYRTRADLGTEGEQLANVFARNGGPTDPVKGPLAFAMYNVPVAQALKDLHDGSVGKSSTLDPHVRELAIMVACRETNYNLEWNGHEASALKAGVDAKLLDLIKRKGALTGLDEKDATVIRLGRQLYTDKKVDSATFAKAVQFWGKRGVMDMVAVMNTYAVSGYFAIAVDEQAAPGKTPLPAK